MNNTQDDEDDHPETKEINMEVGIEDYLNIKMHFPKNIYYMDGNILIRCYSWKSPFFSD